MCDAESKLYRAASKRLAITEDDIQHAWDEHCIECRIHGQIDLSSVYNSDECYEEFKQNYLDDIDNFL